MFALFIYLFIYLLCLFLLSGTIKRYDLKYRLTIQHNTFRIVKAKSPCKLAIVSRPGMFTYSKLIFFSTAFPREILIRFYQRKIKKLFGVWRIFQVSSWKYILCFNFLQCHVLSKLFKIDWAFPENSLRVYFYGFKS